MCQRFPNTKQDRKQLNCCNYFYWLNLNEIFTLILLSMQFVRYKGWILRVKMVITTLPYQTHHCGSFSQYG